VKDDYVSQPNQLWWTEADRAELDTVVCTFIDCLYEHRERCTSCSSGTLWCSHARRALDMLLDWRRRRDLRSRAEFLRREQDELNIVLGGRLERPAA
jgi:hypothetical protein